MLKVDTGRRGAHHPRRLLRRIFLGARLDTPPDNKRSFWQKCRNIAGDAGCVLDQMSFVLTVLRRTLLSDFGGF